MGRKPADRELIKNLIKSGEPVKHICIETGLSEKTVNDVRRELDRRKRQLRNQEIRRMYEKGRTQAEIGRVFGISAGAVKHIVKDIPNRSKRAEGKIKSLALAGYSGSEIAAAMHMHVSHVYTVRKRSGVHGTICTDKDPFAKTSIDKLRSQLNGIGYDYIGGYTGSEGRVTVRCQKCGKILERSLIGLRHRKYKFCRNCGGGGKVSSSLDWGSVKNRPSAPALTDQQPNDDITLDALFDRDRGICYLCGSACDRSDVKISPRGFKYAGEKYPSIDHVIPVSKGGTNTWDNVRLAHYRCNLLKGAKPLEEVQYAYSS